MTMAKAREAALVYAAQALFELERRNHDHAFLLALAALRACAPLSMRARLQAADWLRQIPLPVSQALRRTLDLTVPYRHFWGHSADLNDLRWSPDSRFLLGLDGGGVLSLWDSVTGELVRQFVLQTTQPVPALEPVRREPGKPLWMALERQGLSTSEYDSFASAKLAWHPDARSFLLYNVGQSVGMYDVMTGTLLQHRLGVVGPVAAVRWCAAQPCLLTIDTEHVARVWHWSTPAPQQFADVAHAVLSEDGNRLLCAHNDGAIRLWDSVTGAHVQTFVGSGGVADVLAWRPDGQQMLLAQGFDGVQVWNIADGTIAYMLRAHPSPVTRASWSPDGRYLLTSDGRLAHCWDAATAKVISTFLHANPHPSWRPHLSWSPDSDFILASTLFEWTIVDAVTGKPQYTVEWHRASTSRWSPDGRSIATYGDDINCLIWQTKGRQPRRRLANRHHMNIACSPDGTRWLRQHTAGEVEICELATNRVVGIMNCPGWAWYAAWSADTQYVFAFHTQDSIAMVSIWDINSGSLVVERSVARPVLANSYAAAWNPKAAVVAVQGDESPVEVWDGHTGEVIATLDDATWHVPRDMEDFGANPRLAWNQTGQFLLAASSAGTRIWDWQTRGVVSQTDAVWNDGRTTLCGVGWGSGGPQLLTADFDGCARLWDGTTGELASELEGTVMTITAVAWSRDGQAILAGERQAARIWDSSTGQGLHLLEGHQSQVQAVAWSSDAQQVFTSDGEVWSWIVGTELLEAELIRRVGDVHIVSKVYNQRDANQAIRNTVKTWRGWQREQAAIVDRVRQFDNF
jgi:WD40 repeat protein